MKIREEIECLYEDAIFADKKYDNALLGVVEAFSYPEEGICLLYDKKKIPKEDLSDFKHYLIDGKKDEDEVSEIGVDHLFPTGYKEALVGIVEIQGQESSTLYDREKVLEVKRREFENDYSEEDDEDFDPSLCALEDYYYNFIGGYVGPRTWRCVTFFADYE